MEIQELASIGLTEEHQTAVKMVVTFVQQILHFLPRAVPDYTDHGVKHSNNLMRLFANFLNNLRTLGSELTEKERWVVCLSIWVHDIGVLITKQENKKEHNDNTVKLLKRKELDMLKDFLGDDVVNCLKHTAKYHSSHTNLEAILTDPICHDVRLPLVCAVFRLLDGCDITSARVSLCLYNLLKAYNLIDPQNMEFWDAHLSISSAVFKGRKIVIDCKRGKKHECLTKHLTADLNKINKIFEREEHPQYEITIVHGDLKKESMLIK